MPHSNTKVLIYSFSAIEAASREIVPKEDALWDTNSDLKEWLKNFNHA